MKHLTNECCIYESLHSLMTSCTESMTRPTIREGDMTYFWLGNDNYFQMSYPKQTVMNRSAIMPLDKCFKKFCKMLTIVFRVQEVNMHKQQYLLFPFCEIGNRNLLLSLSYHTSVASFINLAKCFCGFQKVLHPNISNFSKIIHAVIPVYRIAKTHTTARVLSKYVQICRDLCNIFRKVMFDTFYLQTIRTYWPHFSWE